MGKHGKRFPERLQRIDGATVLLYSDSIDMRFDTEEYRLSFELWCDFHDRLLQAANRQDYVGAAQLLHDAMNEGLDEYVLLEDIPDDTMREVTRLEYEKSEEAPAHILIANRMGWPIDGEKED